MFREIMIAALSGSLLFAQADQIGRQEKKPAAPVISIAMDWTHAARAGQTYCVRRLFCMTRTAAS
jgi:hypothetical protein